MGATLVRVRSITAERGIVTARVTATRLERSAGEPVARTQVGLRLPAIAGKSTRDTRERVRSTTLRFLHLECRPGLQCQSADIY